MDETALARKNNISAYLFLGTAVLTFLGTILMFLFTLFFVTDIITPHYFMPPLYKIAVFLLDFLCVAAVSAQVAGYYLIVKRSRHARIGAIVALILTLLTFTPLAVILIYPLVFLLGDEGKNFYKIS
jgi:hypothetical protein